jgi:hypothetical protein
MTDNIYIYIYIKATWISQIERPNKRLNREERRRNGLWKFELWEAYVISVDSIWEIKLC